MKVQEQDQYHGIALTQIVEHKSFKALNRCSEHYGHYMVNTDREVFIKYRKTGNGSWQFVFQPQELKAIKAAMASKSDVFVCLVCARSTVCALTEDEINTLIDVGSAASQSITITVPPNSSCRARGSAGSLKGTIPHNSFPNKLFA
ncbi:hypothetical protein [Dokdonella fugitiva]|uniref:Uncharacterized protein n=1 Tax=Dokdonella fugitiva TaxID=328517 RepID=A0A4V2S237_9GAMM|nr:hypothetical protein [Dokdonella fugitiva]TCO38960.1 hypothetical protein EV148_107248 [Dokdonella fugitiva]